MPTGVKVITTLNIFLVSLFIANLLFAHKSGMNTPMLTFINLVSTTVLVLVTMILLLRLARLVGFARLLIYVLSLVLGLQLLLTLKYLTTGYGALTVLIDLFVIIYAIGMRGYLASETAAKYFIRSTT